VGAQAAGSGGNALRYLARYVFKTATNNRPVPRLPDGRILWPYRASKTGRHTAISLQPLDWMSRFLQHILPPYFARVRTFGWLHPAAKVRANRVRALLREKPLLRPAERNAWQPTPEPIDPDAAPVVAAENKACSAPRCPRCHQPMRLVGTWRAGQMLPHLNRPP
jgi:hypothetical protein